MKSEVFNGQRFWNWFKYDLTQMWRNQMKSAIGIGFSGLFIYILTVCYNLVFNKTWEGSDESTRMAVLLFAFIFLELSQVKTYGFLTRKDRGSAWLMAPASTFEKWASIILMTLVVIPGLFFIAFLGTDWILCLLDHSIGDSLVLSLGDAGASFSNEVASGNIPFGWGTVIALGISSLWVNFLYFVLCGMCFKKNKLLWALLVIFGLSMVFSLIGSSVLAMGGGIDVNIETVEELMPYLHSFILICFLLAVGLAWGIYYRLETLKH